MIRGAVALLALVLLLPAGASAQAVPDGSPAARLDPAYRRWSPHGVVDPFRYVVAPRWGLVLSVGATAENNSLNLADVGALSFLADEDEILLGDMVDAVGLVPRGSGFGGHGEVEGGLHLGLNFGRRVSVSLSSQVRGYGTFEFDEEAVTLLRDGNRDRSDFSLGQTSGIGIATLEAGVHAVVRAGPVGSQDGVQLIFGLGVRQLWTEAYAHTRSLVENGGSLRVNSDSVMADISIDASFIPFDSTNFFEQPFDLGTGIAVDLLLRLEWPTSGFALEAMAANLGQVEVIGVERRQFDFQVETTEIEEVVDVLDTLGFTVRDTADLEITLPRIIRFAGSAWANRILQLDLSTTLPFNGDFETPLRVDLGSTWRFTNTLPIRLGLILGGFQGIGYTAGLGIETEHFFLRTTGGSLGGLFREAHGLSGRFELGFFF